MKGKRSIIWRAALLLLALTCATMSLHFTNAKYVADGWFPSDIQTRRIIATIIGPDPGPGPTPYPAIPPGMWLYYVQGEDGGDKVGFPIYGGKGAEVYGMIDVPDGTNFYLGKAPGGAGNSIGGKGGDARYILWDRPDKGIGDTDKWSEILGPGETKNIVAVAGGGGGAGNQADGGKGGEINDPTKSDGWQG